jgi:hypothetical protein
MPKQKTKRRGPYPEAKRTEALAIYQAKGPRAAAEETGIGRATISRWAKKAGVETQVTARTQAATQASQALAQERRARIRQQLLADIEHVQSLLHTEHIDYKGKDEGTGRPARVVYPLPKASDVLAYATSIGILIDKYRLEMGESTERQRIDATIDMRLRTVGDDELDAAISRLNEAMARPAERE